MLSRNLIKYIRSLEQKKFRNGRGTFVAEGSKLVNDMLSAFESELIIAKPSWMATQGDIPAKELLAADEEDIRRASLLKNPQDVIAVFKQPVYDIEEANPSGQLTLVLDGIQDPGNLGTIIRLADWFGIEHIVCSPDTADVFNPKTVQATMGALAHVKVHYAALEAWMQRYEGQPLYGAFLNGRNIYAEELSATGAIVMGNEGNGIRPALEALVTTKLFIPAYPAGRETSESLNVATATAIVCAEFRRRVSSVVTTGLARP
ncbi:MAG: RNA methyltransferase [Tannerellaceae bacterium]|jgi:TrmH family RNA methyltransferase|nr:RNA methyltransferase [Tannerellaceae bacterium]